MSPSCNASSRLIQRFEFNQVWDRGPWLCAEVKPRGTDRPAGPSVAPTASRRDVPVVTAKTSRPWHAIPPTAASSDELFGPFSEAAVGFVLIRFYHWIEHTRTRRPGHRAHRADKGFGSVTSVRTSVRSVKKDFLQKSVIAAG